MVHSQTTDKLGHPLSGLRPRPGASQKRSWLCHQVIRTKCITPVSSAQLSIELPRSLQQSALCSWPHQQLHLLRPDGLASHCKGRALMRPCRPDRRHPRLLGLMASQPSLAMKTHKPNPAPFPRPDFGRPPRTSQKTRPNRPKTALPGLRRAGLGTSGIPTPALLSDFGFTEHRS